MPLPHPYYDNEDQNESSAPSAFNSEGFKRDLNKAKLLPNINSEGVPERSWGEFAKDTAIGLGQSTIDLGGMAYTAADMTSGGALERATGFGKDNLERSINILDEMKSDSMKAREKEIAETKGFLPTLGAYVDNPQAALQGATRSAATMLMPMGAGGIGAKLAAKGLTGKAAKAAAEKGASIGATTGIGLTEGLSNAQQAKNDVLGRDVDELYKLSPDMRELVDSGLSKEDARDQLANDVERVTAAITTPIAMAAGKLTGAAGLEGMLGAGLGKFTGNMAVRGVKGGAVEASEELIQSGAGQFAQNVGEKGYIDPNTKLDAGVPEAMASGVAVGGLMGAGMGAASKDAGAQRNKEDIPIINDAGEQTGWKDANTGKTYSGLGGGSSGAENISINQNDNLGGASSGAEPLSEEEATATELNINNDGLPFNNQRTPEQATGVIDKALLSAGIDAQQPEVLTGMEGVLPDSYKPEAKQDALRQQQIDKQMEIDSFAPVDPMGKLINSNGSVSDERRTHIQTPGQKPVAPLDKKLSPEELRRQQIDNIKDVNDEQQTQTKATQETPEESPGTQATAENKTASEGPITAGSNVSFVNSTGNKVSATVTSMKNDNIATIQRKDNGKKIIKQIKTLTLDGQQNDLSQATEANKPERVEVAENGNIVEQKEEPPEEIKQIGKVSKGSTEKTITPTGTEVNTQFEVIEASELIDSSMGNYDQLLQPRDRSRKSSDIQISNIANNLDPLRLGSNRNAGDGAPIIGNTDNMVESGNGRTKAIKKAYETDKAENYKNYLLDNGKNFGVDASGFDNPVLVRRRLDDVDRVQFAREANQQNRITMSPVEQARDDADNIVDDILAGKLNTGEHGDFLSSSNRDFVTSFLKNLPTEEQANNVTKDGLPNKALVERMKSAIFYKSYGNEELINIVSENTDNESANVVNSLLNVAPQFIRSLNKNPEFKSIVDKVGEAAELFVRTKRSGKKISELKAQEQMFGDIDVYSMDLAEFFENNVRSRKKIESALTTAANAIYNEDTKTDDMFGEKESLTTESVIKAIIKNGTEQKQETKDLFDQGSVEKTEGVNKTGGRGSEQDGEQRTRSGTSPKVEVTETESPNTETKPEKEIKPPEKTKERMQAENKFDSDLAEMGSFLLGLNSLKVVPDEQSETFTRLLTNLMGSAFKLGYIKFKDNAKFIIDTVTSKFGTEVAESFDLQSMQGSYIAMSAGKANATPMAEVVTATMDEINNADYTKVEEEQKKVSENGGIKQGLDNKRVQPSNSEGNNRNSRSETANSGRLEGKNAEDVPRPEEERNAGEVRVHPTGGNVGRDGHADQVGVEPIGREDGSVQKQSDAGSRGAGRGLRSGRGSRGTRGDDGRGSEDLSGELRNEAERGATGAVKKDLEDFHVEDASILSGGTPVARFNKNKEAISLYNQLKDENKSPTKEQQAILASYTGWGSYGQELFQGTWNNPKPKAGWEERDQWLRDQLGESEWKSAQNSIVNAHYTDPATIKAMWDAAESMGFKGGRVLEPALGVGNFFGMMPKSMHDKSQLTGIELDELTGGMAQMIYPRANISIKGYQDSKTPDDFYDIAISNVPFLNEKVSDRKYQKLNPNLHDYFFLKMVDQVRPGGLVMAITSKGTMDKIDPSIRRALAEKAELVSAIRLPSGAFQKTAGTSVVTDIIILKKRSKTISIINDEWIKSVPYKTKTPSPRGETINVNKYFHTHGENVLGTIDFGHGTTYGRAGMVVNMPRGLQGLLDKAISRIPSNIYKKSEDADHIKYITNHTSDRQGSLVSTDKGLFIVSGEHLMDANDYKKYKIKSPTKTKEREGQLKKLIGMRKLYAALIEAEQSGLDVENKRKLLNNSYKSFVKQYGSLNESFGLTYMKRISDPFYITIAALEHNVGAKEKPSYKPAKILTESTIRQPRKISNPGISDSYVLTRNESISPSLKDVATIAKKPESEVRKYLVDKGAVFVNEGGDIIPHDIYLSGNVKVKLKSAIQSVKDGHKEMQANVDALKKVVPKDIPYHEIEAKMGASWIDNSVYENYVRNMLNEAGNNDITVTYKFGKWKIDFPSQLNHKPEASTGYGTPVASFKRLVNHAISNQLIKIKVKDADGTVYVDQKSTDEANQKIANIRDEFSEWVWSDPERRIKLEGEYNDVRNAYSEPDFDGSFLNFDGMALELGENEFNLRKHQVNAIWRGIVKKRSLNAHEVGTGKTFTMGGIAIESRRYGITKKPVLLAHNANSATVASEIQEMYPSAKILYIDNMDKKTIKLKMQQIANDDWDLIVMPHSQISNLSLKEETLMDMAAKEIEALEEDAREAASDDGIELTEAMMQSEKEASKIRSITAKNLVRERIKIIESIKKQAQKSSREGAVSFEDLGIDMIMVDESHEFKKPPIVTKMKMKGFNSASSNRSIALRFLTKYIRSMNDGGNVHLFTGTPITNTLTEIYHQQRYLMEEEMSETGVDFWDGWFGSFASEVQDIEQSSSGEFEDVTRLAAFINIPELRKMIGQYMDVVFSDDMPEMQPRKTKSGKMLNDKTLTSSERDELENGRTENASDRPYKKIIPLTQEMSDEQLKAFDQVKSWAAEFKGMTGKDKLKAMQSGDDRAPLKYENYAEKASFDIRLLRGEELAGQEGIAKDTPNSKASRVIDNVMEIYNSDNRTTQAIFMDKYISNTGTKSSGPVGKKTRRTFKTFSVARDILERLVQNGIPREQIVIVDQSISKEGKKEVAKNMNSGKVRIVIGSTQSLGVGVNMQKNLRAMHHLNAPWMPGELEQRNGRGHRQGNQWNTVLEYRYLTDRIDGRRWQVLAKKAKFINQFMRSNSDVRSLEGDAVSDGKDDILDTFAEAAGDPRILIKEQYKKKIKKFERKERIYSQSISDAKGSIRGIKSRIERDTVDINKAKIVKQKAAEIKEKFTDNFFAVINGKKYDNKTKANKALEKLKDKVVGIKEVVDIGVVYGYPASLYRSADNNVSLLIKVPLSDGSEHTFAGRVQSITSLDTTIRNKSNYDIESDQSLIDQDNASLERMEQVAKEPFKDAEKLIKARSDLENIDSDMRENPNPPPVWLRNGAPVGIDVYVGGTKLEVTGHRWTDDGWFVVGDAVSGKEKTVSYVDVKDNQGMNIYDKREFKKPDGVIEKESDDSKEVKFSKANIKNGQTALQLKQSLKSQLGKYRNINIVEKQSDLPKNILQGVRDGDAVNGYYDPETNKITLVAENISADESSNVLRHEVFHKVLVNSPAYSEALAVIRGHKKRNTKLYQKAEKAAKAAGTKPGDIDEEIAAYYFQNNKSLPLVKRMVAKLKAYIRKHFAISMSESDIHYLLDEMAKGNIDQGKKLSNGAIRFSKKDGGLTEKYNNLVGLWRELAKKDGIFQTEKTNKTSLEDIARNANMGIDVEPYDLEGQYKDVKEAFIMHIPTEMLAGKYTDRPVMIRVNKDNTVEMNASALLSGKSRGSSVYHIVSTFAHNNGYVFKGDEGGLSDTAVHRRTENMISSALKYGTTQHLRPHKKQNIVWSDTDHSQNMVNLLKKSYTDVISNFPQIRNILYDADKQEFYNRRTGRIYSDQALKNIAKIKQSRSANAGLATIKRTAIANTILQGTVQEGRGRVIQEASRERLGNGVKSVLYSKTDEQSFLDKINPNNKPSIKDNFSEFKKDLSSKVRQGLIDRYDALFELDKKVYGSDVVEENTNLSSWVLAKLSSGSEGAVHAMLDYGRILIDKNKTINMRDGDQKGIIETLKQLGSGEEINRFMGWMAANRAGKLLEQGRENLFTPGEIKAGMKLNKGKEALYSKVYREFNQFQRDVLTIAEKSGVISKDQATDFANEMYVPFYRVMNDDEISSHPIPGNKLSRQQAYKKLKGGNQPLNDLLENTLINFNHLISSSLKNNAASMAIENAEKVLVAEQTTEAMRDKKSSTFILDDGKKIWYNIDDPLVFNALTSLSDLGMNQGLMKVMRKFKRVFTGFTTASPQFIVANFLRDSVQAAALGAIGKKNNAVSGVLNFNDKNKIKHRMIASGGSFSFGHIYGDDPDAIRQSIDRELSNGGVILKPKDIALPIKLAWDKYQSISNRAENANRMAIYEKAIKDGKSHQLASFEARDLLDFSSRGEWAAIRVLTDIVPFLNARLQGLDVINRKGIVPTINTIFGKGTESDKIAAKRFSIVQGAVMLASMALYMAYKDDDDFKRREDWHRDTYWWFKVGDSAFSIPKPFEIGAIGTMAERTLEQFVDDKATGKLFAERFGHMIEQTFSFNPMPQMMKPAYDVYSNRDSFTGRNIEGAFMNRLSPSQRTRVNTTSLAKEASSALEGTFGSMFGKDSSLVLSPIQIDYLIQNYLGWVGAVSNGFVDSIANYGEKPERYWHEYQPIKRFYQKLPSKYSKYVTQFYDDMSEINRAHADINNYRSLGQMDKAKTLFDENKNKLRHRRFLNRVQRKLSSINKKKKLVRSSGVNQEMKRRQLDILDATKNRLAEMAMLKVQG